MLFSEPKIPQCRRRAGLSDRLRVSVLFSEPKIPQWTLRKHREYDIREVSVLFSEPKIPQFCGRRADGAPSQFQCSSASRKFLNLGGGCQRLRDCAVSVLFSEPKIPQFVILINVVDRVAHGFSALQRAENSSICGMIPLLPLV